MEEIRAYILSVTAGAVLCALVSVLAGKGTTTAALLKLMTGVVLAAIVIHPLADFSAVNLDRYLDALDLDAQAAVEAGTSASRDAAEARIKDGLEAYILDKAAQLSLELSVEITLTDDGSMVPAAVVLEGTASPAARSRMESILAEELGIPTEAQTWK